jgi:DNA-binding response OmpR family regulator
MSSSGGPRARQWIRALVLEHDEAARDAFRGALESRGVEVLSATDGASGVAILLDELLGLDVLVTRLDLPHRDARSILHLVRRAGGEEDLAIVVRAPDAIPALRAELLELGADAVIDGPGHPKAVAEAALSAVANRKPLGELFDEPPCAPVAAPPTAGALLTAILGGKRLAVA